MRRVLLALAIALSLIGTVRQERADRFCARHAAPMRDRCREASPGHWVSAFYYDADG